MEQLKDTIKFLRDDIKGCLYMSQKLQDSSFYYKSVEYAHDKMKSLGYCVSLLYMDEVVLKMIYDKQALEMFRI